MSERLLLRAMKGEKATTVVLRGKNLTKVPTLVRKLYHLKTLDLMSNQISKLCPELISLTQLKKLNLGNNKLEEVPEELMYLKNLEILHLFKNLIKSFSPKSFDGLENLNILNMNHNMLKAIPPEINRLQNLRNLSLNNNQLTGIPKELCTLPYLSELHLNYNQIVSIPEEFQTMKNLEKLSLARNLIEVFPVVLCSMSNLKILDIAGNLIQLLPRKEAEVALRRKKLNLSLESKKGNQQTGVSSRVEETLRFWTPEIRQMKLGGFYCEENPFLKKLPMFIEERLEVLPLKEIAARFIMNELNEDDPLYQQTVARFPKILEILANDKECMLCGKYILSSGIAGVIFMPPMKNWKTSTDIKELPHEIVICSQSCFKERTPDIFQLRKT